ncbi:MAG TPA: glucose-6-phosphate dehydrogenase [candidate division Zixibacteria bacterium]|nr:glucose-6-phosphate dehydrogenase [candidate division Zixibacteria bacterium]
MVSDPHAYAGSAFGQGKRPHAALVVIFGASGDLAQRKLVPALYNLSLERRLPERFAVVGYGRSPLADQDFRQKMRAAVERFSRNGLGDENSWHRFAANVYYVRGGYEEFDGYRRLAELVAGFDRGSRLLPVRVLYLATPPEVYGTVLERMSAAGLAPRESDGNCRSRVVVEKPFGIDLSSARDLNRRAHEVLDERQLYRIDHYLGKETVQNIMVFRFANAVFEPIWNRRYVDHVQITAAEAVGVENRGGYYDRAGVVRDMFQNHLLQLLCLTAMEPPVSFSADAVRDEKVKLLRAVRPIAPRDVTRWAVRGQYGPGSISGREVAGYREEAGVARDSTTETYAVLKLLVDNWRWEGVPFYLRSGKRLARRVTEIAIQFKRPPLLLFRACAVEEVSPNVLVLRIQPDEGISLTFEVKPPGPDLCVRPLSLDFKYEQSFGSAPPEAYETLLEDCIEGDSTLFTRHDWVELAWSLVDPVIEAWHNAPPANFPNYEAGSWGPKEADEFIERDGRRWRRP